MSGAGDRRTVDIAARADARPSVRSRHRAPARQPAHPHPRRRFSLVGAVVLGLVAGAGTAVAASANPRSAAALDAAVARVVGAAGAPAGVVAPSAAVGATDESVLDRDGSQSRTAGERPFDVTSPGVVSPDALMLGEPVPSVSVLPPGLNAADVSAGLLSADVPEVGGGTFVVVPGTDPGPGVGAIRTVRVEVEAGLAIDGAAFAATVMATLNDPRGWGADGSLSFARTDGDAELRVVLASPRTVDALCAPLRTGGEVSCGRAGHAALNLRRWVGATPEYAADKVAYRQYLVNHEVGHLLGHQHVRCPGAGQVAPVMQQQSGVVAPCVPNAWPFP